MRELTTSSASAVEEESSSRPCLVAVHASTATDTALTGLRDVPDDAPHRSALALESAVESGSSRPDDSRQAVHAEHVLFIELQREEFRGRLWNDLANQLAGYGYRVMRAWITSGQIALQCHRRGLHVQLRRGEHLDSDAASELAGEAVALALNQFKQVLREQRWSPNGRGTLRTAFLSHCVWQFPNAHRRWIRESRSAPTSVELTPLRDQHLSMVDLSANPEASAIANDELRRSLCLAPNERTRRLLVLKAMGYSHAETADLLGLTGKAVEASLYRYRRHRTP
jgi:hypothetical protein